MSEKTSCFASACFLFPLREGGLLAGGFGRLAVMWTREEGEAKVEATNSASYSDDDEEEVEEVEEEEETDLSPGRKSLHCREKPDL